MLGPADDVTLAGIWQTGATGIVTALHHIPAGAAWTSDEINKRKSVIEQAGLTWSVVESVNIHESIKTASAERDSYIDKYITSLQNLGTAAFMKMTI